jgi:hypothetical protein
MPAEKRELYSSPNGDRWFLARDPATGSVVIRHEANVPSGGRVTEVDIGTLSSGVRVSTSIRVRTAPNVA